ncbi:MAG: F0F1 ATP synthase subunit B [Chloroflexi bacterium]|nr:F0F1 ATP synthase subunit B [Chloroflexota bacterium]
MEKIFTSLGVNPGVLLAQVVNFVLVLGILYLVAYKPLMKMFDERSKKIKESMEQAELIRDKAAQAEKEFEERIQAAAKEGQEIVGRAVRTGEEVRQKAQQEASKEAEVLIGKARREIQRERDGAIDELRKEFADLTVLAAEKVIDRSLDKKAHKEIIEKVLQDSTVIRKG